MEMDSGLSPTGMKPGSAGLFHETETGILPVMKDVYRHYDSGHWYSAQKRRLVHYTVDTIELEPYEAGLCGEPAGAAGDYEVGGLCRG